MSGRAQVWIVAIIAAAAVSIVAIFVSGLVLGEPTMLIPGYRRAVEAEAKAQAERERADIAENKLWHKNNPGRD